MFKCLLKNKYNDRKKYDMIANTVFRKMNGKNNEKECERENEAGYGGISG